MSATAAQLRPRQKPKKTHNELDLNQLAERLRAEPFARRTASFYRYATIGNPPAFRDYLFQAFDELGVLGRVYVAREGINAQVSVPEHHYDGFLQIVRSLFPDIPVKLAVEESESFLKLIIKVRPKIVADGLDDGAFDTTNVGRHLSAKEFNAALDEPGTVVVDVRNGYESEIGHFKNALLPTVDSFREELPRIRDMLAGQEERKILLYCTGGIRCEKASAWLKHHGFKDVNQLDGGIIHYVKQIKDEGLPSKFIGKNFVFDARMGERITDDVIAHCHQCGTSCDTHTNCRWDPCHWLFIQCAPCATEMAGCCSRECRDKTALPADQQEQLRKLESEANQGKFRSRRRGDHTVS